MKQERVCDDELQTCVYRKQMQKHRQLKMFSIA